MIPSIDIRHVDLDAAGMECAHTFRLMDLANEDGFDREWEMGDWNRQVRAFRRKTLNELIGDFVRHKILNVEENEQLTDELHDRAVERLARNGNNQHDYPMIWTFEKLVAQHKAALVQKVSQSLWECERKTLNRELAELYPFGFDAKPATRHRPGPMIHEYWRRLAEATGKLVSEHCI